MGRDGTRVRVVRPAMRVASAVAGTVWFAAFALAQDRPRPAGPAAAPFVVKPAAPPGNPAPPQRAASQPAGAAPSQRVAPMPSAAEATNVQPPAVPPATAPPAVPPATAPPAAVPPAAQPRVTLGEPVLTCQTLSELLLWDNKETPGEVLRRTVSEQTCRNLPGGTVVTVLESATINGTTYQCLRVEGAGECVWAGAVHH